MLKIITKCCESVNVILIVVVRFFSRRSVFFETPLVLDAAVNFNSLQQARQRHATSDQNVVFERRARMLHIDLTASRLCRYLNVVLPGTCQCPLTVKHILVECVELKDVRNKHIVASSIKYLFDSIEAHKVIDFIKETRFYKQL